MSRYFVEMATPDNVTLVIRLDRSYYPALQEMSLARPVRFMSPSGFNSDGTLLKPIGTGHYQVASNTQSETVLVVVACQAVETPVWERTRRTLRLLRNLAQVSKC